MTQTLTQAAAARWIERWDVQQEDVPARPGGTLHRAHRRRAGVRGRPDPLVLDLGCGPGSLAVRLLERIPAATVLAIDTDPLLLELGRNAWAGLTSLRFAERDLSMPGWAAGLGLDRQADAAVSTTALHWLPPEDLGALYAEVASVLRPGGLLLNGDHLRGRRGGRSDSGQARPGADRA